MEYYDPGGMKADREKEFEEWWRKQTYFDFQADLEKYCISDVDILHRCCGHFHSLFMEHTDNIDHFNKSFTIASACNKVYRTMFLQPNQIGIITPQGYGTNNQSTIVLCCLDWITKQEGCNIQHTFNSWEQRFKGVKVDGLAEDGTVFEFHGCF